MRVVSRWNRWKYVPLVGLGESQLESLGPATRANTDGRHLIIHLFIHHIIRQRWGNVSLCRAIMSARVSVDPTRSTARHMSTVSVCLRVPVFTGYCTPRSIKRRSTAIIQYVCISVCPRAYLKSPNSTKLSVHAVRWVTIARSRLEYHGHSLLNKDESAYPTANLQQSQGHVRTPKFS